jgi:hypothetical protein
MRGHVFCPLWWRKCKVTQLRDAGMICGQEVKVNCFLVAGCMGMGTKHVIVLEINEEYRIKIKNIILAWYSTCILYYLNKFNLNLF